MCLWSCKQQLYLGCGQGITSSSPVSSRVWTKWCHFATNGQSSTGSSVGKQLIDACSQAPATQDLLITSKVDWKPRDLFHPMHCNYFHLMIQLIFIFVVSFFLMVGIWFTHFTIPNNLQRCGASVISESTQEIFGPRSFHPSVGQRL